MRSSWVTLVVDDDEAARFLTCRLLQREQVPGLVLEASNGQQALDLLQQLFTSSQPVPPVLVLLDLNMPVMNGWEFLQNQQSLPALCRQLMTTVVLSSSAAAVDRQRAESQASAYVTKPLTQPVLRRVVQQHITTCGLAGYN